jgi:hypothetical protein
LPEIPNEYSIGGMVGVGVGVAALTVIPELIDGDIDITSTMMIVTTRNVTSFRFFTK